MTSGVVYVITDEGVQDTIVCGVYDDFEKALDSREGGMGKDRWTPGKWESLSRQIRGRTVKLEAIICDVDGTVAINNGHRGHFEWDKVLDDTPNEPVCTLVSYLVDCGWRFLFVTGREEVCREDTARWLEETLGTRKSNYQLLMRPTGDYRPDDEIKEEIYRRNIEPYYDILFVLDDRDNVVKKWRELGLSCWQVAEGNF